ncbi:hypothetical protein Mesop_0780 [Mesorhizobium opportunistum WSM2075]|uniref:HPr kinase n=1 Tax=Mesorhizobium opportunistum (strain LMG 24607 / HAMBI 3007 / WSM2075) TaxID=536019 RepID=F7Y8W3_MESOW|nr:hypothetical protein Mesop_0780 [Mesorhizobium opportunistum WSM2075]
MGTRLTSRRALGPWVGTVPITPAFGAVAHKLDSDVVMFSESQQRIYRLDKDSGSVWFDIVAGTQPDTVTQNFARRVKCAPDEASGYVSNCVAQWLAMGFLCHWPQQGSLPSVLPLRQTSAAKAGDIYSIAGARIAISFADARSKKAWEALAGHLRKQAAGSSKTQVVEANLSVDQYRDGYRIRGLSSDFTEYADPAAVAVGLKEAVMHVVLDRQPYWIALHSAALRADAGAVLLAGASGRGKTTLAALLNALGMSAFSDDVTLVSSRRPRIWGMPFSFAVKPGSWDRLRSSVPSLDRLPEFRRPDGRTVKYLKPFRHCETADKVSAIIFPHFSGGSSLQISTLPKMTGLLALLQEAISGSRQLSAAVFGSICQLLNDAEVIEMTYGDGIAAAEWVTMHFKPCS